MQPLFLVVLGQLHRRFQFKHMDAIGSKDFALLAALLFLLLELLKSLADGGRPRRARSFHQLLSSGDRISQNLEMRLVAMHSAKEEVVALLAFAVFR